MKVFVAIVVSLAVLGEGVFLSSATAQTLCGRRDDFVRQLRDKYGETRHSVGIAQGNRVMEIFASDETGSWTILITDPQGTSCLVTAGEGFRTEEPSEVPVPGKDT